MGAEGALEPAAPVVAGGLGPSEGPRGGRQAGQWDQGLLEGTVHVSRLGTPLWRLVLGSSLEAPTTFGSASEGRGTWGGGTEPIAQPHHTRRFSQAPWDPRL